MTIVDRRYSVAEGTAVKAPCRAATTANITLSGEQTIDGVAVVADDRVLVKDQTTGSENGIYTASTGNWSRARDFDGAYDIVTGTRIFVTDGTANGGAEFVVSTTGTITIDTTSIAFTSIIATAIASAAAAAASASAASSSASAASASAVASDASADAADVSATAAAASAAAAAATSIWFSTKAAAEAATVGATVPVLALAGYTARGDAPIAYYVRTASEPSHAGKLQSADGAWWVISGPVIWPEQFGAVGDGVTDDLPALEAAETCRSSLSCELRFMAKSYYLDNPNSWVVTRPRWQGADHNATLLRMDGASAICIRMTGAGGFTSGYMRDLVLWAPASRTTGQALRLDGDATYQPDEFTTSNLKITGTGSWDIPLFHSGADRLSPLGVRVVTHNNLFIGRDISVGVYGETVVQLQLYGGGIYGGTSNQLQLAGDVGASKECTDCLVMGFKINGQLNVDDCTGSVFNIICGSVVFGADADGNCIMGVNSGATTDSGTGNNVAALV